MEPFSIDGKVLIADDEREIVSSLAELVRRQGLTPLTAPDGDAALQCIQREHPDLLLVDFRMPGMSGMEVLQKAKKLDQDLPVVLITAFADVHGAVEAMRAGAHDYLAKPFEHHEIVRMMRRAIAERRCRRQPRVAGAEPKPESLREVLGPSAAVTRLIGDVEKVAESNFSVLILGETGAGKEVIARAIHRAGPRTRGPFVPVDCGAIPETLLESELFGHERGAFTGASQQKPGRFETARGGTLFLDEIANLPLYSQAKLLRVLQDKILYHVGGTRPVSVDARLLAASNHDVQSLVNRGLFRGDLYFRLNEFTLQVPSLRQRPEDIPYLAQRFLDITNAELSKRVQGFTSGALEAMLAHPWSGNVRELRSVIRRAVLLAEDLVTETHLKLGETVCPHWAGEESRQGQLPLREIVRRHTIRVEREAITAALRRAGGNKARAARLLQIDYKTIHAKVKQYQINGKGEPCDEEGT